MNIRTELAHESLAISHLIGIAFASAEHSSGKEALIVERLRADSDLVVSLVVEEEGRIIGHVAFSPVSISDGSTGWFGLGPVAVLPPDQARGVGKALIERGLTQLLALGAKGCVVLGEPAYYGRFGFTSGHDLVLPGVPAEYFQSLSLDGASAARGTVTYRQAFGA